MKRPALDYAALPDVPVSQMTPAEQLIAKVAWISDNAAYGTLEAAKLLIDDIRAGSFTGATPRPSARPEAPQKPEAVDEFRCALSTIASLAKANGSNALHEISCTALAGIERLKLMAEETTPSPLARRPIKCPPEDGGWET